MAERRQDEAVDLHYGHPRMPLSDRAKIFIPFDPLKGFREELEKQERLAAAKDAQSDDAETMSSD